MNNLNTSDGEQTKPAVVSDDEDETELVPNVPVARKKTVRILPDVEAGGTLKIKDREAVQQGAKIVDKKKVKKSIDVNQAHDQWGHQNIRTLKTMANILGYKLVGKLEPCDSCGVVKAKRASVKSSTTEVATKPGMRVFVDTSGPFPQSASNNRYLAVSHNTFKTALSSLLQCAPRGKLSGRAPNICA